MLLLHIKVYAHEPFIFIVFAYNKSYIELKNKSQLNRALSLKNVEPKISGSNILKLIVSGANYFLTKKFLKIKLSISNTNRRKIISN